MEMIVMGIIGFLVFLGLLHDIYESRKMSKIIKRNCKKKKMSKRE